MVRHAWLFMLIGLAGLCGCGGVHGAATPPPLAPSTSTTVMPVPNPTSTTIVPAPNSSATASMVATSTRCQPSELRLSVSVALTPSEKTEQDSSMLTISNVGQVSCYLFGYPGISLFDGKGDPLHLSDQWTGDGMVTSSHPRRVTLGSGSTGYVLINKNSCAGYPDAVASSLRLILPGATTSLTATSPGLNFLTSCRDGGEADLDISPVEPTAAATSSDR